MIKAFLFAGFVCALAQIIKDNTNLTNGHITSLFVVIGSILAFFGVYDKLLILFGGGARSLVSTFGASLYKEGLRSGILNMLSSSSVTIVASIIVGSIITLIFKVKD